LKRESFSCLFKTWPISIDDAIVSSLYFRNLMQKFFSIGYLGVLV